MKTIKQRIVPLHPEKQEDEEPRKKNKEKKKSNKAILTLFKTLSQNKYRLHESIDRKAQILVSVNAIVLSILLGTSFAQNIFTTCGSSHLSVLLATTTISTVFAILSIKPFLLNPGNIGMKNNSLLNYSAIAEMDIETYKSKVSNVIAQRNNVYEAMTEDIYYVGKNIKKKFFYLRISGIIFLFGLILSAILMSINMC